MDGFGKGFFALRPAFFFAYVVFVKFKSPVAVEVEPFLPLARAGRRFEHHAARVDPVEMLVKLVEFLPHLGFQRVALLDAVEMDV